MKLANQLDLLLAAHWRTRVREEKRRESVRFFSSRHTSRKEINYARYNIEGVLVRRRLSDWTLIQLSSRLTIVEPKRCRWVTSVKFNLLERTVDRSKKPRSDFLARREHHQTLSSMRREKNDFSDFHSYTSRQEYSTLSPSRVEGRWVERCFSSAKKTANDALIGCPVKIMGLSLLSFVHERVLCRVFSL